MLHLLVGGLDLFYPPEGAQPNLYRVCITVTSTLNVGVRGGRSSHLMDGNLK